MRQRPPISNQIDHHVERHAVQVIGIKQISHVPGRAWTGRPSLTHQGLPLSICSQLSCVLGSEPPLLVTIKPLLVIAGHDVSPEV